MRSHLHWVFIRDFSHFVLIGYDFDGLFCSLQAIEGLEGGTSPLLNHGCHLLQIESHGIEVKFQFRFRAPEISGALELVSSLERPKALLDNKPHLADQAIAHPPGFGQRMSAGSPEHNAVHQPFFR